MPCRDTCEALEKQHMSSLCHLCFLFSSSHLWGLVDGGHLGTDAQRDVLVLSVPAVQVAHALAARLPPEVQEAVGDGVVLKHDVVHMSVFLQ